MKKEEILDELSRLYSLDQINLADYEKRVDAVVACKTDEEAIEICRDLLPATRSGSTINKNDEDRYVSHSSTNCRDVLAIFSGSSLKGNFVAPANINAAAIFAGTEIDLRQAQIPKSGIRIEAVAIFGGVEIRIPEGITVETDGFAMFGGIERPSSQTFPGAPVIHIHGTAIFGGIEVKYVRSNK